MQAHDDFSLYREALLFLATAGVVAPLFVRLRVSPVLGYVLAGAALGPFGLGRLAGRAPWLKGVLLSDVETISRLNRNQKHRVLRFHGDGHGEGISWELLQ